MPVMNLKLFRQAVLEAVETLPAELLERLNGGIIVEP